VPVYARADDKTLNQRLSQFYQEMPVEQLGE
jgi:hypothetical protein